MASTISSQCSVPTLELAFFIIEVAALGPLLLRASAEPSDVLTLHVFGGTEGIRLIALLDNLGKGASGAAVQSLNLMAGLDETAGLRL